MRRHRVDAESTARRTFPGRHPERKYPPRTPMDHATGFVPDELSFWSQDGQARHDIRGMFQPIPAKFVKRNEILHPIAINIHAKSVRYGYRAVNDVTGVNQQWSPNEIAGRRHQATASITREFILHASSIARRLDGGHYFRTGGRLGSFTQLDQHIAGGRQNIDRRP